MGGFNNLLSPIDRSSRQKLNREILELIDSMNQMDLIYITFQPNTKEYTFFLVPHGTFSKILHILSHKASLDRYRKIKITPASYQTIMD